MRGVVVGVVVGSGWWMVVGLLGGFKWLVVGGWWWVVGGVVVGNG